MKLQVEIKSLRFPFSTTDVLTDVSLDLLSGDFVQICGASGAGKTTLCYSIVGLIPELFNAKIDRKVIYDSQPISEMTSIEKAATFGIITEDPIAMLSQITISVEEEISLGLFGLSLPIREIEERVNNALQTLKITHLRKHRPETLSGGQQVRLSLASIVAQQPKIYIVDDGLGHLDRSAMNDFFMFLKAESSVGKIVLFVSNDLTLAGKFANKVLYLEKGKIVFNKSISKTIQSKLVQRVVRQNSYYEFFMKFVDKLGKYRDVDITPMQISIKIPLQTFPIMIGTKGLNREMSKLISHGLFKPPMDFESLSKLMKQIFENDKAQKD